MSGADLRFLSPQPDQLTLRDHGYAASVSRGVPVYSPASAGSHFAYSRIDGQIELICVADYTPRWFTRPQTVTHLSINHRINSLIDTNALPLSQTASFT